MMRDNRSRRFGFVTFADAASAKVCADENGGKHDIDGKTVSMELFSMAKVKAGQSAVF
jgi:hypothetical protein